MNYRVLGDERATGVDRWFQPTANRALFLHKLNRRYGPLSVVTRDRNSQAVEFVKRNGLYGARFSVRKNYGFSNKLSFRFLKRMQDHRCAKLGRRHEESVR
jgi:hypothetical protein